MEEFIQQNRQKESDEESLDNDIYLLMNPRKSKPKKAPPKVISDDHEEVLRLIKARMTLNKKRGNVIEIDNGMKDWNQESANATLDAIINLAANIIKMQREAKS